MISHFNFVGSDQILITMDVSQTGEVLIARNVSKNGRFNIQRRTTQ